MNKQSPSKPRRRRATKQEQMARSRPISKGDSLANIACDLFDAVLKYIDHPEAMPPGHARALELFRQIKNLEARQAITTATPEMFIEGRSPNYRLRRLHNGILQGVGLYPGDVIAIETSQPPEQGDLVIGLRRDNKNDLAGYYYTVSKGRVLVWGAGKEACYWEFKSSDVEILGRVVAFDAFYDVEELETEVM